MDQWASLIPAIVALVSAIIGFLNRERILKRAGGWIDSFVNVATSSVRLESAQGLARSHEISSQTFKEALDIVTTANEEKDRQIALLRAENDRLTLEVSEMRALTGLSSDESSTGFLVSEVKNSPTSPTPAKPSSTTPPSSGRSRRRSRPKSRNG